MGWGGGERWEGVEQQGEGLMGQLAGELCWGAWRLELHSIL